MKPLESHARLVEGSLHTLVTLVLDDRAIAYRGKDVRRTIELRAIHGVEYRSYLVGGNIPNGTLLRLTYAEQILEFVLDTNADEWRRRLAATPA